jgi:hypothetical protein
MAEQCTKAVLADQFQASAIGSFSSNGLVGWNILAVLSRGDVCLNLCDLDTGQAKSTSCDLDTGQAKSSFHGAGASSVLVQVRSNVEHGRVVEYAQHSHFKSDGTGRACDVSMGAVEILKSTKSASNYLIVGMEVQPSVLVWTGNQMQSRLSFFKLNVAVLSRQSGVLSHQNGQGGPDSVASSCASAIFFGTVALLSASTVVLMMEQLHKGGRTKRVWSQYFVNWSKGGRDIKPCNAVQSYLKS